MSLNITSVLPIVEGYCLSLHTMFYPSVHCSFFLYDTFLLFLIWCISNHPSSLVITPPRKLHLQSMSSLLLCSPAHFVNLYATSLLSSTPPFNNPLPPPPFTKPSALHWILPGNIRGNTLPLYVAEKNEAWRITGSKLHSQDSIPELVILAIFLHIPTARGLAADFKGLSPILILSSSHKHHCL